jgi:hypothetical protein
MSRNRQDPQITGTGGQLLSMVFPGCNPPIFLPGCFEIQPDIVINFKPSIEEHQ